MDSLLFSGYARRKRDEMNPKPRRRNTEQDAQNVWLLLTKGDLSAEEIRRKLKMSKSSFMHARRLLLNTRKIGTVNGKPPTYTVLREVMK